ncbi:TetR/AcrR family transcriptional regulator [Paenibacillus doosanensis]|uniref:Fatty acid metabolism regulator protein n=1 Tax=Paenibacillus konkukensis TaxID=2020716 RepID=A0ABY4RTN5_9BACL|nr:MULTISPECIES: TetR/AcrR family transcriptional regulator [Paenibacillus]MCS7460763.1 TetR/AcrR family transcriptional regulator [Paenibacillus doosanensis]UQZ85944.1 Fatty acid metabolism regulator protein [Paenibacillus konkukensis]
MGQRGRKKGASGEQSRGLLLSIAAEEFALRGYHETKISAIVEKAGVTQPTFYLYFENKEALFHELVHLFRSRLGDYTQKSRLEPGIAEAFIRQRIVEGLTPFFRFFIEEPHLASIGFSVAPQAAEIKDQLADEIRANLMSEQQAGYFRKDMDMGIVADSIVGTMERFIATQKARPFKQPEILADEVVRLFLYGIAAP